MNTNDRASGRRGVVLVVVLAVLVVLSLLGIFFSGMASVERSVSARYLDDVRAELCARVGVEDAVQRITAGLSRSLLVDPAMIYWGANATETGSPDVGTPLERAANPSYAYEDEAPQDPSDGHCAPMELEIDGVDVGFSGIVGGGTHAPNGDLHRLRVTDANAMIHVNDGLEGGPQGHVSRNLRRILNVLGRAAGAPGAGDCILGSRPARGYRAKRELEAVLGAADYRRLRDFVTVSAWVDRQVVNPVPLSAETLAAYPVAYAGPEGPFRYGRSRDADGRPIKAPLLFAPDFADGDTQDHAVFAMDEITPPWIERAARAPVNVNAAPREVLVALLSGLRGWFVVGRRKSNPRPDNLYSFMFHMRYDYRPRGWLGDEYGYLYSTQSIADVDPGTRSEADGPSAQDIADEIIACRTRTKSPHCPALDYRQAWYGGPFRTWRQFNAFCDGLVDADFFVDRRKIFFDYLATTGAGPSHLNGPDTLVPSPIQPKFAARAMADVLKANFNPNCTLNELNPDAPLYLIVDKTDLICNSTEFCFTSMGAFEIESEGIVLATAGDADVLALRKARVLARKRVDAAVKVFEVRRETTQADFQEGEASTVDRGRPATDCGRTMETGPEADNGIAPAECRWSGWIQLATHGGGTAGRGRRELRTTGPGTPLRGETMRASFRFDHSLSYTKLPEAGAAAPLRSTEYCANHADRTEKVAGPYGPTTGEPGRYRLSRDWSAAEPGDPAHPAIASSDLRHDGAYIERDSCVMWKNSPKLFGTVGTACFWAKPSFHPEMTSRPRAWFCMDTLDKDEEDPVTHAKRNHQAINGVWFLACHDVAAFKPSVNEGLPVTYPPGPWHPASLLGGFSCVGGRGMDTPSLNHRSHADTERRDLLAHHQWVHVEYAWDLAKHDVMLWVNGERQPTSSDIVVHPGGDDTLEFFKHDNPIRLGECTKTWDRDPMPGPPYDYSISRNWAADATIDEFYLWKGWNLDIAQDLFAQGRYACPLLDSPALFTSRSLELVPRGRLLPPPSVDAESPGAERPATMTLPPGQARILGAAWTLLPERAGSDGRPQCFDARNDVDVPSRVSLSFQVGGRESEWVDDDGGSATPGLIATEGEGLRYRLRVTLPSGSVDTLLLGSPAIDDVTIYYTKGAEYLSYELQATTM